MSWGAWILLITCPAGLLMALGVSRLPESLGLPEPLIVVAVVLMAIGGFFGAEWVERRLAHSAVVPERAKSPRHRNGAFLGFGAATAAGLLVAFPTVSVIDRGTVQIDLPSIDSIALAQGLARHSDAYYLVDLRSPKVDAEKRIADSMTLLEDDPEAGFLASLPSTRTLVLYGESDLEQLPTGAKRFEGGVVTLRGGFAAFEAQVLTKPTLPSSATPGALAHYSPRSALHAHFTGAAPAAPVEIKPVKVKRARKKEGGADSHLGRAKLAHIACTQGGNFDRSGATGHAWRGKTDARPPVRGPPGGLDVRIETSASARRSLTPRGMASKLLGFGLRPCESINDSRSGSSTTSSAVSSGRGSWSTAILPMNATSCSGRSSSTI